MPKCILLAGAPDSKSLSWDRSALFDDWLPALAPYSGLAVINKGEKRGTAVSSTIHVAWRSLSMVREHLPTGLSQPGNWPHDENTSFLTTSSLSLASSEGDGHSRQIPRSLTETEDEVLSQFYDHSFTVHEDISSSQMPSVPEQDAQIVENLDPVSSELDTTDTSFATTESATTEVQPQHPIEVPICNNLSDLRSIPNAAYLNSISPQTMTVNLIVGVLNIAAPRFVKTRRGSRMEIVELLLGDETKSGFGITFWLPPERSSPQPASDLRAILDILRPQDIILAQNVALSTFRGQVYGQSLRRDVTKLHLLYRTHIDADDRVGCYRAVDLATPSGGGNGQQQIEKTSRVRDWVLQFVGPRPQHHDYDDPSVKQNMKRKRRHDEDDFLPPDSP
jgi:hypothetical protein